MPWPLSFPRMGLTAVLLTAPVFAQIAQVTPDQLRRVDPPSPTATAEQLETRGDELRSYKYHADAIDYYRAAAAKHDTATLHNKIGLASIGLVRFGDAKKEFERAIKMDRKNPQAWNNLGAVYYIADHNPRKAIKQYQHALALEPNQASFHSNLGTALFANKKYDRAAQEYQRALTLDPEVFERHSRSGITAQMRPEDHGEFDYTVAKLYLERGDVSRCLLYLQKAQEEGVKVAEKLKNDSAFDRLKKDPRLSAVIHHEPVQLVDQQ
jgi:tetratricopeptide (TPR) repeat protein